MMQPVNRYKKLINIIEPNKRKYIHYKSLGNFILALNEKMPEGDRLELYKKLTEYFDIIGEDFSEFDGQIGLELFEKHIVPIGKMLEGYGFKRITPIKYLFLYSVMIDSLIYLAFHFPYPVMTLLVLLYYFVRTKLIYNQHKVFGLFY